jgi:hypothetical protein
MNIYIKALMKIDKIEYHLRTNYCESLSLAYKQQRIAEARARINKLMEGK